jgi:hypothetical protein
LLVSFLLDGLLISIADVSFDESSSFSPLGDIVPEAQRVVDGRGVLFLVYGSVRAEALPLHVEVGCADSARSASMC